MKGISLIRLDFDPFGELLFSRVADSKSVKIKVTSNVKNFGLKRFKRSKMICVAPTQSITSNKSPIPQKNCNALV